MRYLLLGVAAVGLLFVGCSDDPSDNDNKADPGLVADVPDAADLAAADDGGLPEDDSGVDTVGDKPACPGDPGCTCQTSIDCDIPLCIQTPAGKVCAQKCVDSCPDAMTCKVGSGDRISYCVPRYGLICRPCDSSKDCAESGLTNTFCVDYAGQGGFCGSFCEGGAECPSGYVCRLTDTVDSGKRKQCIVESLSAGFGECNCSSAAIAGNLSTTCWIA